tara:strand:+ start:3546 stop:4451 length:906 start_codon:yes stop_codon:yes gene_type:complete
MAQQIFTNGDASDAYANKRSLYLSFFHLASRLEVNFKAFITNYSETFSTDWNLEQVFGRNDPIATFKSTARRISVSWDIPAASLEEAKQNLGRCNRLSQFMYPAYSAEGGGPSNSTTLSKPPLMKIRFANLIKNSSRGGDPGARIGGLLAAVNAISIVPAFDDSTGFFDPGIGVLYPKLIRINCDFTALHEHEVGWGTNRGFNQSNLEQYPFGQSTLPVRPPDPDFDDPSSDQTQEQINALEELGGRDDTDRSARSSVENDRRQGQVSAAQFRGGVGGGAASLQAMRDRGEDPYDLSEFES